MTFSIVFGATADQAAVSLESCPAGSARPGHSAAPDVFPIAAGPVLSEQPIVSGLGDASVWWLVLWRLSPRDSRSTRFVSRPIPDIKADLLEPTTVGMKRTWTSWNAFGRDTGRSRMSTATAMQSPFSGTLRFEGMLVR